MSKKPIISKEAQFLLKLLRIALGTEEPNHDADHALPLEGGDGGRLWQELIRLSYEHKVSALAADGLKKLLEAENVCNQISRLPVYSIIKTWFDDVKTVEYGYAYYVEVLKTLCQIFVDHGLTPIILKGYGLSLNYPVPSHRGAGDIDIFLIDKDGNPAAEKGVGIIENILKIKTTKVPHDYEFIFNGIEVELHYDTTNAYWNTEAENYIVGRLTELLLEGLQPCPEIAGTLLPSATFNAVYLMRHMFGHFYTASGNFRQYVDWAMFLQRYHQNIYWDIVIEAYNKSNMKIFANTIIAFIPDSIGLGKDMCPVFQHKVLLMEKVIKNIYHPAVKGTTFISIYTYDFRNRWKHHFLTGECWLRPLIRQVKMDVKRNIKKILSIT